MEVTKLYALFLLAACSVGATPAMFQPKTGFEFLGTVEGKIFVTPLFSNTTWRLTYQDAISTCVSAGYQIATFESSAQANIIKPFVCKSSYSWSWIDGVDFQTPDNFFSINTGKNLTYFEWTRGRPVPGKDDYNCMRFSCTNYDVKNAAMWDVPCSNKLSVICQVIP